jgi:hypothetical protein
MKKTKGAQDQSITAVSFAALRLMRLKEIAREPAEAELHTIRFVSHPREKRELLSKGAAEFLGSLESFHIVSTPVVAITNYGEVQKESGLMQTAHSLSCLHVWSRAVLDPLLLSLWCVKDHSIHYDLAYFKLSTKTRTLLAHSFTGGGVTLNCAVGEAETVWAEDEVQSASEHNLKIADIIGEHYVHIGDGPQGARLWGSRDRPRVARFFHLLMITVRKQADVTFRIAFMIQGLEILFGTSTSELTHRLSLRIALLLGEEGESKSDVYMTLKKCYGVRSTAVHGDVFKPGKEGEILSLSEKLDQIVRQVACRILRDENLFNLLSLNSDKLENVFTKFVLEGSLPIHTEMSASGG